MNFCVFNCGICPSGKSHNCGKCGAKNVHRSSDCDGLGPRCVLKCDYCPRDSNHMCRSCGMFNDHRTRDCPNTTFSAPVKTSTSKTVAVEKKKSDDFNDARSVISNAKKIIVGIVLLNSDESKVLVQKRSATLGGYLMFPGGSLDKSDKTLFDGACREFKEETGMDLMKNKSKFQYIKYIHSIQKNGNHVYNFVLKTSLSSWKNNGSGAWESEDFDIGENACYGHNWVNISDTKTLKGLQYILKSL